jgi:hypothetical protein
MNNREFWCIVIIVAGICGVSGLWINSGIEKAKIESAVRQQQIEAEAKINAQTEVQKTEIEQKAATERTREWMNFIPWYKGGQNK